MLRYAGKGNYAATDQSELLIGVGFYRQGSKGHAASLSPLRDPPRPLKKANFQCKSAKLAVAQAKLAISG